MQASSQQQIDTATTFLVLEAIEHVDQNYGPNSLSPQEYHHTQHTIEVINSYENIGMLALQSGRITPVEFYLGKIASAWHDAYYDATNRAENEQKSADLATKAMSRFAYFGSDHIERVKKCILATKVTEFSPRLVQSADPKDYLQGIVADADLSYFGWESGDFLPRALSYFAELKRTMGQKVLPFLMSNVVLLQNHQWNTTEAGLLYSHIEDNIIALKSHQTRFVVQ